MPIEQNKTFSQTPSKLRWLWSIAQRLIGEYEDFDKRLTSLESRFNDFSLKLSSLIDRIKNV
jgi:hypothetical protein